MVASSGMVELCGGACTIVRDLSLLPKIRGTLLECPEVLRSTALLHNAALACSEGNVDAPVVGNIRMKDVIGALYCKWDRFKAQKSHPGRSDWNRHSATTVFMALNGAGNDDTVKAVADACYFLGIDRPTNRKECEVVISEPLEKKVAGFLMSEFWTLGVPTYLPSASSVSALFFFL